jgi:hypothetical protein
VRLSLLGTWAIIWLTVTAPNNIWRMWSSRWNKNWQGNRSSRGKYIPVQLCPPQIPHDVTWARTNRLSYGMANNALVKWLIWRNMLVRRILPCSISVNRHHIPLSTEYASVSWRSQYFQYRRQSRAACWCWSRMEVVTSLDRVSIYWLPLRDATSEIKKKNKERKKEGM